MKNYILDSGLLSEKTTNAYSILFYITPLLNSIEATTNDAFEEINDHNELGREDYTSIKSNIEHIKDYMDKYKTFGAVTSGAGQNNSSGYNYNYGGNNQYQSSTTGYSNNDGFIGEYQREVDNIFSNAQSNTVNKLSESKLQDIRVNNNLEIKSELPASPLNMQVKKSTGIDKKEIGIEDLLDSGTISVVMQKEYNDMKVEIEAQNKSLPEYNSADYPKYLPGFIKEDLYEAKIDEERIDNCDEYVNKIVTSADFDYETDIEKTVSTTLDFVPFVGQGKMALEAVLGIDLVSGRHLSKEEQLLILGTMGLGSIVEDGYKGIKAGMASEAEQTTSKTVLSMGIGGSSGEIEKLMKSATEKILSKRKAMLEAEEAIAKVEGEDAINAALKDADIAAEVSEGVSNPLSNDVVKQLENAPIETKLNKVTEQMEPYMKQVLGDDYKLILRRDVGEGFSHGDLDHWNIEVQTSQGKMKFDRHLYADAEGNIQKIVDYIPQRRGKPIVNVIFDNTNK